MLGLVIGGIVSVVAVGFVEAVLALNDALLFAPNSRRLTLLAIATPTIAGLLVGLLRLLLQDRQFHGRLRNCARGTAAATVIPGRESRRRERMGICRVHRHRHHGLVACARHHRTAGAGGSWHWPGGVTPRIAWRVLRRTRSRRDPRYQAVSDRDLPRFRVCRQLEASGFDLRLGRDKVAAKQQHIEALLHKDYTTAMADTPLIDVRRQLVGDRRCEAHIADASVATWARYGCTISWNSQSREHRPTTSQ